MFLEINWKDKGKEVIFLINTSNEKYKAVLRKLQYPEMEEGFGRNFSKDIPHLRRYFERFKEIAEEMIKQAVGEIPIPWEEGLLTFLKLLKPISLHYWVTGSCALALYGVEIVPHDIDLVTDSESALKLGKFLDNYIYEPVTDTKGWFCKWFGRAFLHVRLEWIGGVFKDENL